MSWMWWRQYAVAVMHIIGKVFGDIDTSELPAVEFTASEQSLEEPTTACLSDWAQVRDDSSLNQMLNTCD